MRQVGIEQNYDIVIATRMTNKKSIIIGTRDLELLTLLEQHPFTANQLLQISETFLQPFTHERLIRRRLSQLRDKGLVKSFPYAVASNGGSPHYWKLTRDGWTFLNGKQSTVPKRRYFEAISPGHHFHTLSLAQLLTHLMVQAHRHEIELRHFARENSLKLEAAPFTLYPDCAFQLVTQDGRSFNFVVELDNGTERVRSKLDVESIERKLRGYDAHQSQFEALDPERYLVLFVTTRSQQRLKHILDLAAMVMQNPQRTVFIGSDLNTVLAGDPFADAQFVDHRGLKRTLIPTFKNSLKMKTISQQNPQRSTQSVLP